MRTSVLTLLDEAQLLIALKAHSHPAFEILYDRFAPALLGILVKMVKDEGQAQDLLQDSMIKIWNNIHQHDPAKGRLFTWLLNVTRNTARDYLKSPKSMKLHGLESVLVSAQLESQASFQPSLTTIGFRQLVMITLSARHWQVIEMLYFQGYTQQEVAELLELPLGTVKTWTRTALQQLKATFSRDYNLMQFPYRPVFEQPNVKAA